MQQQTQTSFYVRSALVYFLLSLKCILGVFHPWIARLMTFPSMPWFIFHIAENLPKVRWNSPRGRCDKWPCLCRRLDPICNRRLSCHVGRKMLGKYEWSTSSEQALLLTNSQIPERFDSVLHSHILPSSSFELDFHRSQQCVVSSRRDIYGHQRNCSKNEW